MNNKEDLNLKELGINNINENVQNNNNEIDIDSPEVKKAIEGNEWNYKDSSKNIITEAFKKKFFTPVKGGKMAVSAEGLKVLASRKGIKSLTVDIIKFPDKADETCIVKATLIGYDWDREEQKICTSTYSEIGDATTKNCSVAQHYIRMASTRAVGRVLRNYTNIGLVCSDELGGDVIGERVEMATEKQIYKASHLVHEIGEKSSSKYKEVIQKLEKDYGVKHPAKLTVKDCSDFISYMNCINESLEKQKANANLQQNA